MGTLWDRDGPISELGSEGERPGVGGGNRILQFLKDSGGEHPQDSEVHERLGPWAPGRVFLGTGNPEGIFCTVFAEGLRTYP